MNFYRFQDIKAASDCAAFARDVYGCTIKNGRTAAKWRGGDNPEAVTIDREKFYDHKIKAGGGIFELAAFKVGTDDKQQIQAFLGEYYRLTPTITTGPSPSKSSRYDHLIEQGYHEAARYEYRDLSGDVRHITVRLEHPERSKEFVQGHPTEDGKIRWTLKGIETILYRLPEITASDWVVICEGEKSADRLAAIGIPTTTSPMGAGKWLESYSDALEGKDVAICPDNDEPGAQHAETVAKSLHGKAAKVVVVDPDSELPPKAGIDDWLAADPSRGINSILSLIKDARAWEPPPTGSVVVGPEVFTPESLAIAKRANETPFRNYIETEIEVLKRGKPVKEIVKEPKCQLTMIEDLHRRFLGFPRKVGDYGLFDFDKDTLKVELIEDPSTLQSWIGCKSKKAPKISRQEFMEPMNVFFKTATKHAARYEGVSTIPDWPYRREIFYGHPPIPPPCPYHSRLMTLVDSFLPTTEHDRHLIAAFFCAPIWYIPGVPRPAWIIDSKDGQGSGKSKIPELAAYLYGVEPHNEPIGTKKHELDFNFDRLTKRILSHAGRLKRILIVDNVTGSFTSPELSSLISARSISGMSPYGKGEETRLNDLTVVITVNTATVDSDIADRCLYIHINKPSDEQRNGWIERNQQYIDQYKYEIFADIIHLLESHQLWDVSTPLRFAEFGEKILQPCCGSPEAYAETVNYVIGVRSESNVSEEQARGIIEAFNYELDKLDAADEPVFIRTDVVNSWGGRALRDSDEKFQGLPIQQIRNLIKTGFIPCAEKDIRRLEKKNQKIRYSGVAWNWNLDAKACWLITKDGGGNVVKNSVSL